MEKTEKTKILIFFALVFIFLVVSPATVQAASLYFSPSSGSHTVGATFSVNVSVSSVDQAMNAVSGIVTFSQDKLEVISLIKTGSIFNLWVEEPLFSNSAGTVNFEGIILNPGFTGTSGKIITINFKIKAAGQALLAFSSGSVLANDGRGTNILASLGNAQFSSGDAGLNVPEATTPSVVSGTPSAPQIFSPTHTDPNKWYAKKEAKFAWSISSNITGVRLLVSEIPSATPTVTYAPAINEKEVADLEDGIWYFHVQLRNASGWGGISHFRFQIDTEPPMPFEIKFVDGKETTNSQPTLIFETSDEISGIDYYEVKIDQGPFVQTKEKEYKTPAQGLGMHTIIVKAVDRAGNHALAMAEINILPIKTPVITDCPQTLLPDSALLIKGTAAPETQLRIYIQKDGKEARIGETKSDKEGKWTYNGTDPLEKGVYKIWIEAIDYLGTRSQSSEEVMVQVIPPAFIRIGELAIDYLTTFITLLVLILVIVSGMVWGWRKITKRKKRLGKEVAEAEKALRQGFKALKEKTEEQVAKLDGKPDLSTREKKICNELKKALRTSEKFIGEEIKDIEKELR